MKLTEEKQQDEPGVHYVLELDYDDIERGETKFQRINLGEAQLQQIRLLQGAAESEVFICGTFRLHDMRSDVEIPQMDFDNGELDILISLVNLVTGGGFPFHRFKGVEWNVDRLPIFIV